LIPFRNSENRYLASSSKDGDIRIWDSVLGQTLRILTGHTQSVTCLRWGGSGLIYSGSQDRTIKVWRPSDVSFLLLLCHYLGTLAILKFDFDSLLVLQGILCRTLEGHGHWVNTMGLSTDYVMRTGPFDPADAELRQLGGPTQHDGIQSILHSIPVPLSKFNHSPLIKLPQRFPFAPSIIILPTSDCIVIPIITVSGLQKLALERYESVRGVGDERLVSGSDDFTMMLWTPEKDKKSIG